MNLLSRSSLKRLLAALLLAGVVTLMTGAPGGYGVPAYTGLHGSFLERVSYFGLFRTQRWFLFLTLGKMCIRDSFSSLFGKYLPVQAALAKDFGIATADVVI